MNIHARLKRLRAKKGVTLEAAAKQIGVAWQTVQQWEKENGTSPTRKRLDDVAEYYETTVSYLLTGDGGNDFRRVQFNDDTAIVGNDEYPAIRHVNLKLSAGISGYAVEDVIEDKVPLVFSASWFDKNNYTPNKLIAVNVTGESMQPSLNDGDTVVINTQDTDLKDGSVYAVNYEGELLIKRMVRDAGAWWLSSDNLDQHKYPRKRCDGDYCIVIGKIVHKQSERI